MPLAEPLERVRSAMVAEFQAGATFGPVRLLMDHVLKAQGKMIRPGLVLAAGQCLGGLCDQHIEAAAIMEMIHQATLLHDDVLDCAEVRRGNPSANHLWGNSAAVLLGDLVLSHVLRRCADLRPEVARVVADMACSVCRGELRQTLHRAYWQMTEDEYLEIIADKSASFFGACCRVGAILADALPEQADALAEYGLNVGMAFQMTDDVLDLVADSDQTGKSAGRDVGMGTPTLPVIHLLYTMDPSGREDLLDRLGREGDLSDRLRDLLVTHGSLDYVRSRCRSYVGQAMQSLDRVGSRDAQALLGLGEYCLARVR
jgi:geranylgeranyl pyrophosphate synthase